MSGSPTMLLARALLACLVVWTAPAWSANTTCVSARKGCVTSAAFTSRACERNCTRLPDVDAAACRDDCRGTRTLAKAACRQVVEPGAVACPNADAAWA